MKHITKITSLAALLLFFNVNVFSQGEANWWYFGSNAGVSFQSGSPVAVAGGQVNTGEGCASISDNLGNLLFYTDGIIVYNRNHIQMPNGFGLMGDPSTTQSGVIVQKPGSTTIYYIFTADVQAGPDGFRWSEVDMTLQAGLGDVTANKNILLYAPSTERICGVKHCNNTDIWVVTHEWDSNGFRSYLVTASGINPVPVISNSGTVQTGTTSQTIGYMKSSPDGTRLALAIWDGSPSASLFELFNFNNSTGVVSNGLVLGNFINCYGLEFSPNSTLLYGNHGSPIDQWNLCAGSDTAIIASRTQVATSSFTIPTGGSLQLGPDNKIYNSRYGTLWLGVINNPNVIGAGCNYVDDGVALTSSAGLGLPNFIQSYLRQPPVVSDSINCLAVNFSYATSLGGGSCTAPGNTVVSTLWNFGDPGSGSNNTSSLTTPVHNFSASGTYTVNLVVNYTCYSDSVTSSVTVQSCGVNALVTGTTAICSGACTDITAVPQGGTPPYSYSWSPNIGSGAGPFSVCPTLTTTYTVTITDSAGTSASATGTVTVNSLPPADLSPSGTLAICNSNGVLLNANSGDYNYTWYHDGVIVQTGAGSTYFATLPGVYQVQVGDLGSGCTSMSQTTTIVLGGGPVATIVTAGGCGSVLFNGGSVTLTGTAVNAASYLWSPGGETTASIQVTQPGTYCVTAFDASGCPSDSPACTTVSTANVQCGQNGQKVILCHVPPGNPGNPQTLCIAPSAVPAHLANHPGDCLGPCSLYYPRLGSGEMEEDMDYSFYIDAYPNPFQGTFSLEIINSSSEPVNIIIYDMIGRVVERYNDVNEKTLIGSHLKAGVYFVVAQQEDNITRVRIVKD